MKARGQLKTFLLLGSITGNVVLALSIWDRETVSAPERSAPQPRVTRSWEDRVKNKALKRRIIALEEGILEARRGASKNESHRPIPGETSKHREPGISALRQNLPGAESVNQEKVTRAVEALVAQLELPDYEEEEVVYSAVEEDGEVIVSTSNSAVLNFDDEDEFDYDKAAQDLRMKILPFLPHKEALFRGLLKGFTKSKNVEEREIVLSLFNEIREFLGSDESVNKVVLEFVADSNVAPEFRLELLDIVYYPGSGEEGAVLAALQGLASHPVVEVRERALGHLLDFNYPDQARQFEALARDTSEETQIRVLGVCGLDLDSRASLDFVIGLSRGSSKELRFTAMGRLAEDGSGARKELFHELIQHSEEKRELNILINYLLIHGDSDTVRILKDIEEREESESRREYFVYMRENLETRLKEARAR